MKSPGIRGWLRRTAAVLALVLAGVVLQSQPASAGLVPVIWLVGDSFENPATWFTAFDAPGGSRHADVVTWNSPRTGTNAAWIETGAGAGSFASIGRYFTTPSASARCTASVYLKILTVVPSGHNWVNVEVINPSTWSYVAVKTFDFGPQPYGWYQATVGSFTSNPATLIFRVSELGANGYTMTAFVDDMLVLCTY